MSNTLERCSPEIVEEIVTYLSLQEICNLRLTNSVLASLASQTTFKSYFVKKLVHCTWEGVDALRQATARDHVGRNVQDLTLVGIVVDTTRPKAEIEEGGTWVTELQGPMRLSVKHTYTSEELERKKADLEMMSKRQSEYADPAYDEVVDDSLAQAFRNIVVNSKSGELSRLSLQIVVHRDGANEVEEPLAGGGWDLICSAAAALFHRVLRALADSQLKVKCFHVFTDQQRCSLPYTELAAMNLEDAGLKQALSTVDSFCLSLASALRPMTDSIGNADRETAEVSCFDKSAAENLATLLSYMPALQALELHWYLSLIHI